MKRRSFLGALAAILVAPKYLAHIQPAPGYNGTVLGLVDIMGSQSLEGLSSNTYARWNP